MMVMVMMMMMMMMMSTLNADDNNWEDVREKNIFDFLKLCPNFFVCFLNCVSLFPCCLSPKFETLPVSGLVSQGRKPATSLIYHKLSSKCSSPSVNDDETSWRKWVLEVGLRRRTKKKRGKKKTAKEKRKEMKQ